MLIYQCNNIRKNCKHWKKNSNNLHLDRPLSEERRKPKIRRQKPPSKQLSINRRPGLKLDCSSGKTDRTKRKCATIKKGRIPPPTTETDRKLKRGGFVGGAASRCSSVKDGGVFTDWRIKSGKKSVSGIQRLGSRGRGGIFGRVSSVLRKKCK